MHQRPPPLALPRTSTGRFSGRPPAAPACSPQDLDPLFRTAAGRTGLLTANAYRMIQRRAKAAGIQTRIGNHTFRATGITAYLKNHGTLETAQHIANHASPRTTMLYDRRQEELSLDEVERIAI